MLTVVPESVAFYEWMWQSPALSGADTPQEPKHEPPYSCARAARRGVSAPERSSKGAFAFALQTGRMLVNASDSGSGEKRYWWLRPCNTAQEGGEDSALGSNGCRVSIVRTGYVDFEGNLAQGWVRLNRLGMRMNLKSFLTTDLQTLQTDVLKSIRASIDAELKRRHVARRELGQLVTSAFPGLPGSNWLDAFMGDYFDLLMAQDWSELFAGGDPDRRYYVYCHVLQEGRKCRLGSGAIQLNLPGIPFYVGKGTGDRAYDMKRNQGHGALLRQLVERGSTAHDIAHIVARDLTESQAFEVESKLIYFFGTRYEQGRKGLLLNLEVPKRPEMVGWREWIAAHPELKFKKAA